MKAIAKTKAATGVDLIQRPMQETAADSILVKIDSVGICGSDVHIYEWTPGYEFMQDKFPVVLGHEFSGVVAGCGPGASGRFKEGDRVTMGITPGCGKCRFCTSGKAIFCPDRKRSPRVGLDIDGAMAEYLAVPEEKLLPIPDGVSFEEAALSEPASVSLEAVRLGRWDPGDTALVIGPGPIGLVMVPLLKALGAGQVLISGLEIDRPRLEVAKKMGADEIIVVDDKHGSKVREAVGRRGADVVFEASGSPLAASMGLEVLRAGCDLVLAGIYPRLVEFDATHHLVRQMKTIRGSYSAELKTEEVLNLLASGELDLKPVITNILPLDRAVEGFEEARRKIGLKIVLKP